jgi:hypothetical protein
MKRLLLVCMFVAAAVVSCKQGEGERCQVDDDCANGLACNRAKNTCQSSEGGDLDAGIIDAVPADGAVDAPPDAVPDAP